MSQPLPRILPSPPGIQSNPVVVVAGSGLNAVEGSEFYVPVDPHIAPEGKSTVPELLFRSFKFSL